MALRYFRQMDKTLKSNTLSFIEHSSSFIRHVSETGMSRENNYVITAFYIVVLNKLAFDLNR